MAATKRLDYLGSACSLGGLSIPDFTAHFCGRCRQPECTRSQHGTTLFDQRVQNWESRLFLEVPRMDQSDARFPAIAAQQFKGVNPSLGEVSSQWSSESEDGPSTDRDPALAVSPVAVNVPQSLAPTTLRDIPRAPQKFLNTPTQPGGVMLNGAKPSPSSGEVHLKPGQRVRIKGSD